jgi:hypothetical protein
MVALGVAAAEVVEARVEEGMTEDAAELEATTLDEALVLDARTEDEALVLDARTEDEAFVLDARTEDELGVTPYLELKVPSRIALIQVLYDAPLSTLSLLTCASHVMIPPNMVG